MQCAHCCWAAPPRCRNGPRALHLAQELRIARPVRVAVSALARTPSLIGWLAPVIVLPASTLLALTPRQLEMVIAHELAHVRRADYLVNLLQVAVETLLFHHPAVHWISRDVRELREVCCDDLVLRGGVDPLHYADTLASLEALRSTTHAPAMAATAGSLLLRVRRIVGVAEQQRGRVDGQAVVLLLALLALALLLGGQHSAVYSAAAAAPPPIAIEVLSRSAVASIGAAIEAPAAALRAPDVFSGKSIAVAASPVEPAVVRGPVGNPAAAAAPTPRIASAAQVALQIVSPDVASVPIEVDDIRAARRNIRPLFVFADSSPLDCAQTTGSRICRPLRNNEITATAQAAR